MCRLGRLARSRRAERPQLKAAPPSRPAGFRLALVPTGGWPSSGDYAGAARAQGPPRYSIAFRTLRFPLTARPRLCEDRRLALSSTRDPVMPPGNWSRLSDGKGDRMFEPNRTRLNWFARALGTALLVSACGVFTFGPAAAQSPAVLRMARNAEPGIFIPWLIDDNTALFTLGNVYDGLLRVTKDGAGVEPALAESWDTSADGLTWTFHLRQGVKFSDGTPLTANDVKVSLDLARGGTRTVWKDNYKAIKEIHTPDPMTVEIVLSQPHAPLLSD